MPTDLLPREPPLLSWIAWRPEAISSTLIWCFRIAAVTWTARDRGRVGRPSASLAVANRDGPFLGRDFRLRA
jgi:hypothetical protein